MIKVYGFLPNTSARRNPHSQRCLSDNPNAFFDIQEIPNFLYHPSDRGGIFHHNRLTNTTQPESGNTLLVLSEPPNRAFDERDPYMSLVVTHCRA
jgi:hypothetical protein